MDSPRHSLPSLKATKMLKEMDNEARDLLEFLEGLEVKRSTHTLEICREDDVTTKAIKTSLLERQNFYKKFDLEGNSSEDDQPNQMLSHRRHTTQATSFETAKAIKNKQVLPKKHVSQKITSNNLKKCNTNPNSCFVSNGSLADRINMFQTTTTCNKPTPNTKPKVLPKPKGSVRFSDTTHDAYPVSNQKSSISPNSINSDSSDKNVSESESIKYEYNEKFLNQKPRISAKPTILKPLIQSPETQTSSITQGLEPTQEPENYPVETETRNSYSQDSGNLSSNNTSQSSHGNSSDNNSDNEVVDNFKKFSIKNRVAKPFKSNNFEHGFNLNLDLPLPPVSLLRFGGFSCFCG